MEGESMSEWKEVRLGDIIDLVIDYRGKTPKKLGGDWSSSGYRALSAKNIKTGQIVQKESIRYVDESLYKRWMQEEVKRGDILITSEAPFGQIYLWDSDEKIVLSQRLFDVRIRKEHNSTFVYYQMQTRNFQSELDGRTTGTTVVGLRQPELLKCHITIPDINTQNQIAGILSSLDAKIETNNKLNEKLEEMAQAIFKSWFVDFEPFKDKPFHETELGMIPEGWDIYTIDEFCRVFTGKKNTNQAEKNGKYPFFSCAPNPLNSNDYLYDGYAIIIAGNGSYTGRTQLYNGKFDLYQRTYACVAKERSFDKKIVFFYLLMKQTFEKEKMGGTRGSSIPYIVMNDIAKQYFCYNESVVSKFCNIVRPILDMKHELQVESKRLASLRDTLLPRLMSGELIV